MSKRSRIITLVTLSILIFLCLVLGITYAFMRNSIDNNSFTEISLSSCATITLSDENSINLSNSYPMSRNKALQTTPYTFTVSGLCEGGVLFNVYVASLANNTLDANNIHYIITNNGSKEPLIEGILGNATDGINDFNDSELKQISTGINGEYGNIYNLYTDSIHFDMEKKYDLYLYVDSSVTSDTMNQTFEAGLAIKAFEYEFATISDVSTSNITNSSVTLTVTATAGQNAISKYYFSNDGGSSYIESTNNIHTFNDLDSGVDYDFKIYVVDEAGYKSAVYSTKESTADYTLANVCLEGENLASCIAEFNTLAGDGADGIYLHDADLTNGANDNNYRYSGASPNNYVCFGATGADCQNAENQYRIIGVFDNQVKLIKATNYGDYAWDADNVNTWDETTKPDIYTTLNTTYYNTLGSEWQNLIAESTWQVGGMAYITTNTVKQYYDVEVGTGQSGYEETMKIGLMYVSDYGYGASPEKWTTALYEENYGTDNWLYLGDYEWLLSRNTGDTDVAFLVNSSNGGNVNFVFVNNSFAVRPSFSLTSTATISSGTGTSSDPFVLNLG